MSDSLSSEKEIVKLEKYLVAQGRQDFIDAVRGATSEALDSKMLGLAKHREEIKNTKKLDGKLTEASELKKQLDAPYKEQMRMNEKLTRFVSLVMKDKETA